MGRIKSAWEIALERTEDIVIDADRIRHSQNIDKIRRIAGAYLIDDQPDNASLSEKLSAFDKSEVREALSQTILNGLTLPADEVLDDRYTRLSFLLSLITANEDIYALFGQIAGFLTQYPKHKEQLIDQLKSQFEPLLREKEEQMKSLYGENYRASLEQDKEFLDIMKKNLERLDEQYSSTLEEAKGQLKSALE